MRINGFDGVRWNTVQCGGILDGKCGELHELLCGPVPGKHGELKLRKLSDRSLLRRLGRFELRLLPERQLLWLGFVGRHPLRRR